MTGEFERSYEYEFPVEQVVRGMQELGVDIEVDDFEDMDSEEALAYVTGLLDDIDMPKEAEIEFLNQFDAGIEDIKKPLEGESDEV